MTHIVDYHDHMRGSVMVYVASVLLSIGCSDSLFDSSEVDPAERDASVRVDAGGDGAVVGSRCPSPCVADLVVDFDGTANGANGLWRYLNDTRARSWQELVTGSYQGAAALVSAGEQPPAIIDCREAAEQAVCSANPGALLLLSSEASDAALEVTLPKSSSYQLSGEVTAAAGSYELRLYRNTREDLIYLATIDNADGQAVAFSSDLEARQGDRLLLAITPVGQTSPIAVELFVSEKADAYPGACVLSLAFDEHLGSNLLEDCGLLSYKSVINNGGIEEDNAAPSLIAGPIPELGTAISFGGSDYLKPLGASLDYSADFTLQMWLNASASSSGSMYGDRDPFAEPPKGMNVFVNQGPGLFGATLLRPSGDIFEVVSQWPGADAWHFARVVRNTATKTLRLCIDGQMVSSIALDTEESLAAAEAPYLGRSLRSLGSITAAIDDVRVSTRALPCAP